MGVCPKPMGVDFVSGRYSLSLIGGVEIKILKIFTKIKLTSRDIHYYNSYMAIKDIKRLECKCEKCGAVWTTRTERKPVQCPRCNRRDWDKKK